MMLDIIDNAEHMFQKEKLDQLLKIHKKKVASIRRYAKKIHKSEMQSINSPMFDRILLKISNS